MKKIVVFASGSGSNAENIISHFKKSDLARVAAVFSNNPEAQVLQRAIKHDVPTVVFSKAELSSEKVLQKVNDLKPDLIVLAGFLLKFPDNIIAAYSHRIINIHPALLPKYGGKGMYGMNVHRAVLENGERETGISIHYVNSNYDEGRMIAQYNVSIENCPDSESIAQKIHELEKEHFPKVVENLLINVLK